MSLNKFGLMSLAAFVLVCCLAGTTIVSAQNPSDREPARPGENAEELAQRALDAIDSGDLERAWSMIRRARQIKPDVPKLDLAEGLVLMEIAQPQYLEAIQRLTDYTVKSDEGRNDYRGHAALGRVYKESRMYRQAIRPLEQAKKLAPAEEKGKSVRAEITMDLAMAYFGLNQKKEALETAKEAAASAPNDAKMQFTLAQIAGNAEEYALAESAAKRAVDLLNAKIQNDPFNLEHHNTLRFCYSLLGRIKEIARKASPDDGSLYFALAVINRDGAEVERRVALIKAREYASQAIEKEPKKAEWQVFAAKIEADLGAFQQARDRLNEVLRASPDNQEAADLLKMLPGGRPSEPRPK